MRKSIFAVKALILLVILSSCSISNGTREGVRLNVLTDAQELNQRLDLSPQSIPFQADDNFIAKFRNAEGIQSTYTLTQIAHISAPSAEIGENAGATYLAKEGDYLYITYNTRGADYGGGVDAYNLNTESIASLTYSIESGASNNAAEELSAFEWNSLMVNGNRIAVVGDTPAGALLFDVEFENGVSTPATKREVRLPGVSGNAVAAYNGSYYTSVGGDTLGGVFQVNVSANELSVSETNRFQTTGMKYLAVGDDVLAAFKGRNGAAVYLFEADNGNEIFNLTDDVVIDLGFTSVNPVFGKNDITIQDNYAYVALGDAGYSVIDLDDEEEDERFTLPGATNSVLSDGEFIYAASGERFHLIDADDNSRLANLSYEDASANFAFSFMHDFGDDNGEIKVIALANGTDGVRLLAAQPLNASGSAGGGSSDIVSSGFYAPEGYNMFRINGAQGDFLFEILDENDDVVQEMGAAFWPRSEGQNIYVQMVEGSRVRSTYSTGGSITELDNLANAALPSNLIDNPAGGRLSVTSRYYQGTWGVVSLDNRYENDYARVRVDANGVANSEQVVVLPPNSRTYVLIPLETTGDRTIRLRTYTNQGLKNANFSTSNKGPWPGF